MYIYIYIIYIVRHFVLSLVVWYVFGKYLNVQIFKHFKLKCFKATCMSLLHSYELRKGRARDRAKQAAETKEKRETRLSKRRSFLCLKQIEVSRSFQLRSFPIKYLTSGLFLLCLAGDTSKTNRSAVAFCPSISQNTCLCSMSKIWLFQPQVRPIMIACMCKQYQY